MFIPDVFDAFIQDVSQYFPLTRHQLASELPKTALGKYVISQMRDLSEDQHNIALITAQVAALVLTCLTLPSGTPLLLDVTLVCITTAIARRAYLHFHNIAQAQEALRAAARID